MSRKEASRKTILPKTLKDLRSAKDILITPLDTARTTDQPLDDLLWKEEDPSTKYILSHKFNQVGAGWIGFENCQGLRTVFVKIVKATEVFHSKNVTYLIYDFDRCDLPLSMVHASPNVQFTEADIAIVCRQVLTGLYHGSIKLLDLVLSQSGQVKIAARKDSFYMCVRGLVGAYLGNPEDKGGYPRLRPGAKGPYDILLRKPAVTDGRMHVNDPRDVSREACKYIEMTKSATYRELFQVNSRKGKPLLTNRECDFLLKAPPKLAA
ncbi:hypothetical protein TSTA_033180 [Talaromyces stipitatus ATCC 10500]|uniref:Uncharacterized protein n=1 Tax=Talaromyces stipitatus (strain ATCC 10500 / CBS 375.48 / QM 6759 / NRRL 1006) TaxID=441959 RepID=B8M5U4_TALSN|nr:uncharacterized protein TSTA_033180 [Talaromyces stipitatus ATCC 10500]EED20071.1 hypothetical protein TSTA_033180 [Talaromyces stipitatus ATCC 10500]